MQNDESLSPLSCLLFMFLPVFPTLEVLPKERAGWDLRYLSEMFIVL